MSEEIIATVETAEETTTDAAAEAVVQTSTTLDLTVLTADQLLALSEEQWEAFYTVVKAAIATKSAEEKAALKAKFTAIADKALPVIKYAIGAAVLLKVFNVI